jgi:hypothetical protein
VRVRFPCSWTGKQHYKDAVMSGLVLTSLHKDVQRKLRQGCATKINIVMGITEIPNSYDDGLASSRQYVHRLDSAHCRNVRIQAKSFRTGRLERELQTVQLFVTRCSCIAILWVSLVSFAAITLCVASYRVVVVYFVIDSVRKLLDTASPSYMFSHTMDSYVCSWHI